MAASWIKVRNGLSRSAKIVAIACHLSEQPDFVAWWNAKNDAPASRPVTEFVTKEFVTAVTLKALTELWQEVNELIGPDCWVPYLTLKQLTILTGIPCFGEALELVGWVERHPEKGLVFPNFYEYNQPEKSRPKAKSDAERSKEYRDRKRNESARHESSHREEKRREEKNNPPPPAPSAAPEPNRQSDQLAAEAELISMEVSFPRKAVQTAYTAGATLDDIRAICEFYRANSGAWGPGALNRAVEHFVPGKDIALCFPTQHGKHAEKQRLEQQAAADRERRNQDVADRARDKRIQMDREARHGPLVRALDDDALGRLIDGLPTHDIGKMNLRKRIKNGRASPSFLEDLYRLMDQQQTQSAAAG